MTDHHSKKSEPLVQLPDVEKIEEEIKSEFYELRKGKVWFSKEIKREHHQLKTSLFRYVLHSRFFAVLTAPFIYACIIPFVLLDLFVSTYQAVCFPVYGIPKARRRDYIAIDRNKLRYLNALEGLIACTARMGTECWRTSWRLRDEPSSTGARSSMRGEFRRPMTAIRIFCRMAMLPPTARKLKRCAATSRI